MKPCRLALPFAFNLLRAGLAPATPAAVQTYSDKAAHLAASGATQATLAFSTGGFGASCSSGSVTFQQVGASGFESGNWTARLPGTEISTNGLEDLDVVFAAPVSAFGFDFAELQFDPLVNAVFVDSTLTVTLLQGSTSVGSFAFNAPNDTAAFVGATSASAFDRVQIRETTGGIENELFGQFYTAAAQPVPEPASGVLCLAGMAGIAAAMRRRRSA